MHVETDCKECMRRRIAELEKENAELRSGWPQISEKEVNRPIVGTKIVAGEIIAMYEDKSR